MWRFVCLPVISDVGEQSANNEFLVFCVSVTDVSAVGSSVSKF